MSKRIRGWVVAPLACVVAFALSMTVATAQSDPFEECVQDCIDTYEVEITDCSDELQLCLSNVAQQVDECIDQAAGDPIQEVLCVRQGRLQREVCDRDFRKCENFAVTNLYNCYRDCVSSPVAP